MDATHTYGKELLAALYLLQALYPVLLHLLAVSDIVIRTTLNVIPLCNVVAQERLAVASADEDATGVGHLLVTLNSEESRRTGMHAWPNGVGTQTEHQLEDGLIGLRSHLSEDTIILIVFPCPVP